MKTVCTIKNKRFIENTTMQRLAALRQIKFICLHCTAGNQNNTAEQAQGFARGRIGNNGYHVLIERTQRNSLQNSGVRRLVSDDVQTSGIKDFRDRDLGLISNANTIHICWIGGLLSDRYGNVIRDNNRNVRNGFLGNFIASDNRSEYQKYMLQEVVRYYVRALPSTIFLGHNQISPDIKSCPNFDVRQFCRELKIPENRIYQKDNFGVVAKLPQILKNIIL
jgi:hypothetical protein